MRRSTHNPWLHAFAVFTAFCTLWLIGLGGLVTSHGVGMAVPDWPNTYGYNMFLFPPSQWIGGIFYEHTHRLLASFVAALTTILCVWLWVADSRRWLRWFGTAALVAVLLQALLGGLRVVLNLNGMGVPHAGLAQLFFFGTGLIALVTSPRWPHWRPAPVSATVRRWVVGTTLLIFVQLLIAATMRHQHAGLAVPDFPLAYGRLYPPTDPVFLNVINANRVEVIEYAPITAFQIHLHMIHRFVAVAILAAVAACAWKSRKQLGPGHPVSKWSLAWTGMIVLQAGMGAWTVWSNKAADVATGHVLLGALSLFLGGLLSAVAVVFGSRGTPAPVSSDAKAMAGSVHAPSVP